MSQEVVESDKGGRPKGSKNAITLLKLSMEQQARERNLSKIQQIIDGIFDAALEGDFDCRKLVWQSVMSRSGSDLSPAAGTTPQIIIRTEGSPPPVKRIDVIEGEILPVAS